MSGVITRGQAALGLVVRWTTALTLLSALGACSSKSNGGSGFIDDGQGDASGLEVLELRANTLSKVDLLLTLDNSRSMADKQRLLAQALPTLLERLQSGSEPGLPAISDLHLGVISSSLGSHGATGANDACTSPSENDHAQLLGKLRGVTGTYQNEGFLAWDPAGVAEPPGESNATTFAEKAVELVESAGESGCGQPATLEAWYRFLVDPEPPLNVVVVPSTAQAIVEGVDHELLDQRAAFLRPDSLLIIAMLSDGDDCSVQDEGYGWLLSRQATMFRSTSQCHTNPNDPCCQSCGETTGKAGCPSPQNDAECAKGMQLIEAEDPPSLRCFDQKRRFGFDLLYPTARYADALRSPVVTRRSDALEVSNPLFTAAEGKAPRSPSLVRLLAVVGVPWQDIADESSLTGAELRFLSAAELSAMDRWDVILGDPSASPSMPPTDPLMIKSLGERAGRNPITADALVASTATNPRANPINGHEHAGTTGELQYACIYPLDTPRECDASAGPEAPSCDCTEADIANGSPLCQPPEGGPAGSTQYFAKAEPGLRFLQTLRAAGENSSLASICPKVLDEASPSYGYLPAVDALITDIRPAFAPTCLRYPLPIDESGSVQACSLAVTFYGAGVGCDCATYDLVNPASTKLEAAALDQLRRNQYCDFPGGPHCESYCTCEVPQHEGDTAESCRAELDPPSATGYCYVSADEPAIGNPELVARCPASYQRNLILTGAPLPPGAHALLICDEGVLR